MGRRRPGTSARGQFPRTSNPRRPGTSARGQSPRTIGPRRPGTSARGQSPRTSYPRRPGTSARGQSPRTSSARRPGTSARGQSPRTSGPRRPGTPEQTGTIPLTSARGQSPTRVPGDHTRVLGDNPPHEYQGTSDPARVPGDNRPVLAGLEGKGRTAGAACPHTSASAPPAQPAHWTAHNIAPNDGQACRQRLAEELGGEEATKPVKIRGLAVPRGRATEHPIPQD